MYYVLGLTKLFLSPKGRANRLQFICAVIFLAILAVSATNQQSNNLILGLVQLYISACIYIKRFHDFGKSGVFFTIIGASTVLAFYILAPQLAVNAFFDPQAMQLLQVTVYSYYGFWIAATVILLFVKGNSEDNLYGSMPAGLSFGKTLGKFD